MAAWDDHRTNDAFDAKGCIVSRPEDFRRELPSCWEFFTDDALIELLADTSYELGRRGVRVLVG